MTAADLFELDAFARREALQVGRSLLLQAPAGSGKTTVLTARFMALLAVVDAPEQILAITFTRKAAAEMRHRIMTALHAAVTGQQVPGIEPALLQAAARRDHTCGWQLLHNPTRLRVETIDALNHSLATSLPVSAGSGSSLRVNTAPAPLHRRAARRALHAALCEPEAANPVLGLFERLDNSWERLEQLLADMLAERSHWLPRVLDARAEGLAQRVAQSLDSLLRVQLAGVQARLPVELLSEARALLTHSARADAVPLGENVLSGDPASLRSWRALCALALTDNDSWRRRLTVREGFGPGDAAMKRRAFDWIAALESHPDALATLLEVRTLPDAQLSAGDQDALEALTALLTRAAAELQLVFCDSGQVDYVYVAAAARQALSEQGEPSELALRSSGALRHVLIDEFQDTSFEQFELLRALCVGWQRGDGRTLFIVGDPMQSIYQFREAEVGLFLRARAHGVTAAQFSLARAPDRMDQRALRPALPTS
jgi:ATP-dependent exoDNAse (exonuclease V) beta subunit